MTILKIELISAVPGWFLLITGAIAFGIGVLWIMCIDERTSITIGVISFFLGIFLIVSAVFDVGLAGYTSYTIIFDEENPISAQEFLEKYEILDVDGKIYTVREREVQE